MHIKNLYTVFNVHSGQKLGNFKNTEDAIGYIENLEAADARYNVKNEYDYRFSDEYLAAIRISEQKHIQQTSMLLP